MLTHFTFLKFSIFILLLFNISYLFAQDGVLEAEAFFMNNLDEFNATSSEEWIVTDVYTDTKTGIKNIYLHQSHQGILLENHIANIHLNANNEVIHYAGKFIPALEDKIANSEQIEFYQAVQQAFDDLDLPFTESQSETYIGGANKERLLRYEALTSRPVKIKLIYVATEENIAKISWSVDVYLKNGEHWWNFKIDADNGFILDKKDQLIHCSFGEPNLENYCNVDYHRHEAPKERLTIKPISEKIAMMSETYNVYPLTVESPSHGSRSIEVDPFDLTASPFGWHDTDGSAGAEYTITRGNNVLAQEDENGNNGSGFRPDGGASLTFDFPIDFAQQPTNNRSAALTNLFYWNNIMHDLTYAYGFTEAAGNFQENNYGNGGEGDDYVLADGLDGSGINNANFGTPADGSNPRMQMFLWSGNGTLEVNSPMAVEGAYMMQPGSFGDTNYSISGDLVLVDDGSADPTEACDPPFVNAADINGNIALIDRGNCEFGAKSLAAQDAGAIAVIICNNEPSAGTIAMGGGVSGNSVNIPAIMISFEDCVTLRTALPGVNVTFSDDVIQLDGDFDNGIIAHEYGHGISNRLTGGPNTTSCLGNTEQMGEGWSDFWGLVTAVSPGDDKNTKRGIGTYANSEPTDATGIRNFPYSYDLAINPVTYEDIKTFSIPHGIGSVWCSMLWDMYWELVEIYGYDEDLYYGTGGNNIAINLVLNGMKMQPCSPGFVDGRDAILAADDMLYGGANKCTIWKAFARRGMGFSASQGNTNSRTDGVEAFDVPMDCNCEIGSSCDDGDDCTINDVFDGACNCIGIFQDSDEDGVCDAEDQCPGFDDTIDENTNGIPDACENCESSINLMNETVSAGAYVSQSTIITSGAVTVAANDTVLFDAKTSITLGVGFVVASGANFTAKIEGCDSPVSFSNPTPPVDLSYQLQAQTKLKVVPNPASDRATFQFFLAEESYVQIKVMDLNGQVVELFEPKWATKGWNRADFYVDQLTAGIYVLSIQGKSILKSTRFVVQQ